MSLVFDTSLYMNGGAGGGVSLDKIIVKSDTIPAAAAKYVGAVYQYVGDTNATYTHGYIYECKSSVSTTAIVNFEPHKVAFDVCSLVSFFEAAGDTSHEVVSGRFKYLEAGDIWNINGLDANGNTVFSDYQVYTQDLVDAGFVIIVPMTDIADDEEIVYELVYRDTTSYAWERIDVQPGATRGRFLALWNCATGLAETNPPSSPYPYGAGDYFIVGTVGTINYKPSGSSYVIGTASTTVETDDVAVNDTYYYDGANWHLQKNTATTYTAGTGISISNGAISVASPTLINTALTSNNSLTIQGNNSSSRNTINIGYNSRTTDEGSVSIGSGAVAGKYTVAVGDQASADISNGVAIGRSASVTGAKGTAIGYSSAANGRNAIAIGNLAKISGDYSIQIGDYGSTIPTASSKMYVGNHYPDNWELLDLATGKIPLDRLPTISINEVPTITNQNENVGVVTPLKVWEGTSTQYNTATSPVILFYGWAAEDGTYSYYTNEYPITTSSNLYWVNSPDEYYLLDIHPTETDGTSYFITENVYFEYAPSENIGGGGPEADVLYFVEGVGVKRNGVDIATKITLDTVPTQGSTNGITSGAVYTVLGDLETALHNINSGS